MPRGSESAGTTGINQRFYRRTPRHSLLFRPVPRVRRVGFVSSLSGLLGFSTHHASSRSHSLSGFPTSVALNPYAGPARRQVAPLGTSTTYRASLQVQAGFKATVMNAGRPPRAYVCVRGLAAGHWAWPWGPLRACLREELCRAAAMASHGTDTGRDSARWGWAVHRLHGTRRAASGGGLGAAAGEGLSGGGSWRFLNGRTNIDPRSDARFGGEGRCRSARAAGMPASSRPGVGVGVFLRRPVSGRRTGPG